MEEAFADAARTAALVAAGFIGMVGLLFSLLLPAPVRQRAEGVAEADAPPKRDAVPEPPGGDAWSRSRSWRTDAWEPRSGGAAILNPDGWLLHLRRRRAHR